MMYMYIYVCIYIYIYIYMCVCIQGKHDPRGSRFTSGRRGRRGAQPRRSSPSPSRSRPFLSMKYKS